MWSDCFRMLDCEIETWGLCRYTMLCLWVSAERGLAHYGCYSRTQNSPPGAGEFKIHIGGGPGQIELASKDSHRSGLLHIEVFKRMREFSCQ